MKSFWNPLAEKRDVVPRANKCVNRNCLDGVSHDMAEPPALIVLHTMVCCWPAAEARFRNANDSGHASAHYGVCLDGSIKQWVDEKDAAYHAGNFAANMDSIGIEHEDCGDYNGPRTPELYAAAGQLVADIAKRYGIPLIHITRADYEAGRSGIIVHREISDSPTACPDALDVAKIITIASEGGTGLEMTANDWAAIYRLFIALTEDDRNVSVVPPGASSPEDQIWGQHFLENPVAAAGDLIKDAEGRGPVGAYLAQQIKALEAQQPSSGVPSHKHVPGDVQS